MKMTVAQKRQLIKTLQPLAEMDWVKVFCATGEGGGVDPTCGKDDLSRLTLHAENLNHGVGQSNATPQDYKRRKEATEHISKSIDDNNPHAPAALKKAVATDMHMIANRLTAVGAARLKEGMEKVVLFGSDEQLSNVLASHFPDKKKDLEQGNLSAGTYMENANAVFLSANTNKRRGIAAHEMAHAIDGPYKEISNSKAWKDAWQEEVKATGKLTNYAAKTPSEGFAEFGRLLWSTDVTEAKIKQSFPKMWAVMKKERLV